MLSFPRTRSSLLHCHLCDFGILIVFACVVMDGTIKHLQCASADRCATKKGNTVFFIFYYYRSSGEFTRPICLTRRINAPNNETVVFPFVYMCKRFIASDKSEFKTTLGTEVVRQTDIRSVVNTITIRSLANNAEI